MVIIHNGEISVSIYSDPKCSRKGQKYTQLLDGSLVKGYPWRIWVINNGHPSPCMS